MAVSVLSISAQDTRSVLETYKEEIVAEERTALKKEVEIINAEIAKETISREEAQEQKKALAKKHAANIEDRIAILENKYALQKRNAKDSTVSNNKEFKIPIGDEDDFVFKVVNEKRKPKYDKRTRNGPVIAVGVSSVVSQSHVFPNSPYELPGSRFFEMGWNWRMRVFENSNWLRVNYGVSFQLNGLKVQNNRYFVQKNGKTVLDTFGISLKKSKLRMDNLVIPIHVEFGPSKLNKTEAKMRYDTKKTKRYGFGGFVGFPINTIQKLKYTNRNGEKIKEKRREGFNRSDIVYGLSGYIGVEDLLFYLKYDISPIFENAEIEEQYISIGLRIEI